MLDTLAFKFKGITGLSTRMDVVAYLAVEGGDCDLMTESRLSECERYLAPYIIALAFKYLVTFDIDVNMEIARRTAIIAAVAVTADIKYLILTDTCRNCYIYSCCYSYSACT